MTHLEKTSNTPGSIPSPGDVATGEISMNSEDEKIFLIKTDLNVVEFTERTASIFLVVDLAERNALTDLKDGDFVQYVENQIKYLETWMTNKWHLVERTNIVKLKYTFHSPFQTNTATMRFSGGRMRMKKGNGAWTYYNPDTTYTLPGGGAVPVVIEEEFSGYISAIAIDNSTVNNTFIGHIDIEGGYNMASISNLFWDFSQVTSINMKNFYAPKATTGTNTFRNCYKLKCITNLDTTTLDNTTASKFQMFIGCNALIHPTAQERALMTADHGYDYETSSSCP